MADFNPVPMISATGMAHGGDGNTVMVCTVKSVDGKIAHVKDQLGKSRQIPTTRVFGKGIKPRVGENWLITLMGGQWTFAVCLNDTDVTAHPDGDAGGDLDGTYPNPQVVSYNGGTVFGTAASKDAHTSADASTVVLRDVNGRGNIVTPTSSTQIANKSYVDTAIRNNDLVPNAPTSLAALSTLYLNDEQDYRVQARVGWDPPTTYTDSSALTDISAYEISWKYLDHTGDADWKKLPASAVDDVSDDDSRHFIQWHPVLRGKTIRFRVRTLDRYGNRSSYATIDHVASGTFGTPPTPSDPVVDKHIGMHRAHWDGNNSDGSNPPVDFKYLEVHWKLNDPTFTPSKATLVHTMRDAGYYLHKGTYKVAGHFKFIEVDKAGNKSSPTGPIGNTPDMVLSADIDDAQVLTQHIVDLNITNNKIANGTIAAGKVNFVSRDINGITTFTQSTTPTGAKTGDIWIDTGNGNVIKQFNGTVWTTYQAGTGALAVGSITAASGIIASIDATVINTGTLNASLIKSGTITSATIALGSGGVINIGTVGTNGIQLGASGLMAWNAGIQTLNITSSGAATFSGLFSNTQTAGDQHIEIQNAANRNKIVFRQATAGYLYSALGSGPGTYFMSDGQLWTDTSTGAYQMLAPKITSDSFGGTFTGPTPSISWHPLGIMTVQTGANSGVIFNADYFHMLGSSGVTTNFSIDPGVNISMGSGATPVIIGGGLSVANQLTALGNMVISGNISANTGSVPFVGGVTINGGATINAGGNWNGGPTISGGVTINGGISTPSGSGSSTFNTSINFNNTLDINATATFDDMVVNSGHGLSGTSTGQQQVTRSQNGNIGYGYDQPNAWATVYVGGGVVGHFGSAGIYTSTSTKKIKKLIRNEKIDPDLADRIRYVNFRLRKEEIKGETHRGVIAEELYDDPYLKNFVRTDRETNEPVGVDYAGLALATSLSTNVKFSGMNDTIERLERRIAVLESKKG